MWHFGIFLLLRHLLVLVFVCTMNYAWFKELDLFPCLCLSLSTWQQWADCLAVQSRPTDRHTDSNGRFLGCTEWTDCQPYWQQWADCLVVQSEPTENYTDSNGPIAWLYRVDRLRAILTAVGRLLDCTEWTDWQPYWHHWADYIVDRLRAILTAVGRLLGCTEWTGEPDYAHCNSWTC